MSAIETPIVIDGLTVGLTAFQVIPANTYAAILMVQNLEATANLRLATDAAGANTFVKITPGGYWTLPSAPGLTELVSAIYGIFDATPALAKSATVTVVR